MPRTVPEIGQSRPGAILRAFAPGRPVLPMPDLPLLLILELVLLGLCTGFLAGLLGLGGGMMMVKGFFCGSMAGLK